MVRNQHEIASVKWKKLKFIVIIAGTNSTLIRMFLYKKFLVCKIVRCDTMFVQTRAVTKKQLNKIVFKKK